MSTAAARRSTVAREARSRMKRAVVARSRAAQRARYVP